jgi:hypothetical protein
MTKERPIIFSAPMIRAILDGSKTQTRRVVRNHSAANTLGFLLRGMLPCKWLFDNCPYGKTGDSLWCRENFSVVSASRGWERSTESGFDFEHGAARIKYADGTTRDVTDLGIRENGLDEGLQAERLSKKKTVPSIHMPRWASRIDLMITCVRVERLQEISKANAIAEGATSRKVHNGYGSEYDGWSMDWSRVGQPSLYGSNGGLLTEYDIALSSAQSAFGSLINQLHGGKNWNLKPSNLWFENPWVWVINFQRVKPIHTAIAQVRKEKA